MVRDVTHNIVYGPKRSDRPVHKLPFDPKCHELFVIVYLKPKIVIWIGSLTKTNRENINVKYYILF